MPDPAPLTSVYWDPKADTFYARRKDGTKKAIRSEVGFELAKRMPQETFEEWQRRAEYTLDREAERRASAQY